MGLAMKDASGRSLATLGDALAGKLPALALAKPDNDGKPPATPPPPASPPPGRPSRIAVYAHHPPEQLHQQPPPEGPDRSLVAKDEPSEPGRTRARKTTLEQRVFYVKRALEELQKGKFLEEVAKELGVKVPTLQHWIHSARAVQGFHRHFAPPPTPVPPPPPPPPAPEPTPAPIASAGAAVDELGRVSAELSDAMARVKQLKKKLRSLLGED